MATRSGLEELIPAPRLLELDQAEVQTAPVELYERLRHGNLGASPLVRALFALRTIPERLRGDEPDYRVRLDDLSSSPERPGFQILSETAPNEFCVGAIGKVWQPNIEFVHVGSAAEFSEFDRPGFVKVAWAVRVLPLGASASRVEFELRVDATDDESWHKFRRYFRVIGPASHFIRRSVLGALEHELGTPESKEDERALPGDELLSDAAAQVTHGITIEAPPERIWPWLLQMGCRRAGFYAIDWLDNAGVPSARELHPELTRLAVGQIIPATPDGEDGFQVLRIDDERALILGGLFDVGVAQQLPFSASRPELYWHVTWAFVLERLDEKRTRLHVRARAAFAPGERLRALWIRPVHHLMQTTMLRHLKARAEDRPFADAHDVAEGVGGGLLMLLALFSPFLRRVRSHLGLDATAAARAYPGDDLVPEPRWSFTHGIEIDAPAGEVWPWIAQVGADRGGFYSYQWLENLVGCEIRNAERVHPDWALKTGDTLVLHPDPRGPRLVVTSLEQERYLVAYAGPEERARSEGKPWVAVSWLFFLEPLDERRCRFISRFRSACSDDLATLLVAGPTLLEPVSFVMDRRMLLGVKERAERAHAARR
jgi:hypothetical protein